MSERRGKWGQGTAPAQVAVPKRGARRVRAARARGRLHAAQHLPFQGVWEGRGRCGERAGAACGVGRALGRGEGFHPALSSPQTLPKSWAALRSRWRYLHAARFAVGPPLFLLRRVSPPLAANTLVFCVVAADHAISAATADSPGGRKSLLPPISASVATSLDSVYRLALFAVALLLTLRLGRVYERWWAARQAFSALGSTCVQAAARALLWGGEEAADGVARWAVAWHFR